MSVVYMDYDYVNLSQCKLEANFWAGNNTTTEETEIGKLKYYTYGIVIPGVIFMGIIGNIISFVVLNHQNMKGTAYIYMKGRW